MIFLVFVLIRKTPPVSDSCTGEEKEDFFNETKNCEAIACRSFNGDIGTYWMQRGD